MLARFSGILVFLKEIQGCSVDGIACYEARVESLRMSTENMGTRLEEDCFLPFMLFIDL